LTEAILGCLSGICLLTALQFRSVAWRVARSDEVALATFPPKRVIGMVSGGDVAGLLKVAASNNATALHRVVVAGSSGGGGTGTMIGNSTSNKNVSSGGDGEEEEGRERNRLHDM
jgi:hypothetical protein